ncbi:MAG: hypothetical protein ACXVPU_18360 [Bacteroidia bacterium]
MKTKPVVSLFISVIFFFAHSSLLSQNKKIDSLQTLVNKASEDTSKVELLNTLSGDDKK